MPTFDITSPDGRKFRVSGPEGSTQEQALMQVQSQYKAPQADTAPGSKYIAPHNVIMGSLKSAADIGATLLRPVDAALNFAGVTDKTNVQRREDIGQFFKERANTDSLAFKGGELATDIAGTAGIGGLLAKGAKAGGAAPKIVSALETGGFRLGPTAATAGAGRVGDAALRVGAGAAGGGAAAGLVGEDAAMGAGIGAALPVGVKAAGSVGKLFAAKGVNPTLAQTLQDAQAAGYVVPPSMAGAGVGSRLLEGLSGKYKTNQAAAIKNQQVTDDLARQAVGLQPGTALTSDAMQQVRNNAFKAGYEPLTTLSTPIGVSAKYTQELDDIARQYSGPAKSFPGVAKSDVQDLVNTFKTAKSFPANDALGAIQILRDNAGDAFRAGNKALGKAQREIADILEDQIEQSLTTFSKGAQNMHPVQTPSGTVYMTGADMLKNFREARTLMAKAHTVEDAIREGGGVVDAKVIARNVQSGKRKLTGELETIGKFANNFGDVAGVPKSGNSNPLTVLDFAVGSYGVGSDNPALMALPLGRVSARSAALSKPYQRRFVTGQAAAPSGRVNALLENPVLRNALIQSGND